MQTPQLQRPRDLPACLSRSGLGWAQARLRALARSLPILPAIYQRGNKKAHEIAADLCVNIADWAAVTPPPLSSTLTPAPPATHHPASWKSVGASAFAGRLRHICSALCCPHRAVLPYNEGRLVSWTASHA